MTRNNPSHFPGWEKDHLKAIRDERTKVAATEEALGEAIHAALNAGCTVNRVAEAAGLTRFQLRHRYPRESERVRT